MWRDSGYMWISFLYISLTFENYSDYRKCFEMDLGFDGNWLKLQLLYTPEPFICSWSMLFSQHSRYLIFQWFCNLHWAINIRTPVFLVYLELPGGGVVNAGPWILVMLLLFCMGDTDIHNVVWSLIQWFLNNNS